MDTPKHPKTAKFVGRGIFTLKSFKELEVRISALGDNVEMGDALEVFAEAYFVTQRGVDPKDIWPIKKVPHSIRKELNLPGDDYGIDGLYRNEIGGFDAYQSKFKGGRPTLLWQQLSTFVGLADGDKFGNKVIFTNCEELGPVLSDRIDFYI
jgi:hypothetical protein